MEHMGIFDEICGDLGLGKDPHAEAAEWCIAEFKRLWTLDEKNGVYKKVCRVFFIPCGKSDYSYHYSNNQSYWGRGSRYDNHFAINSEDSRILAPLGLEPQVSRGKKSYGDIGHCNSDFMNHVSRTLGVDPQRLNLTEMIRDGVEIELLVPQDRVDDAIKNTRNEYEPETINSILSKEGWLGSYVRNGETKAVNCFLIWACFGLKIPMSSSVEQIDKAFAAGVCPTLKAMDVERARFIRARVDSVFGTQGGSVRGKSITTLMEMVKQFDDILLSIGVEPPRRNGQWKSEIPRK